MSTNKIKLRGTGTPVTKSPRPLLHKDGRPVRVGDHVTSFRGEAYVVTGWPTNGHNRVWVRMLPDERGSDDEFFPSVFEMHWGDAA